jgi:DNA-binding CsgD family transcriptional regulator
MNIAPAIDPLMTDLATRLRQGADPFAALEQFHTQCGVRGFRYGYFLLKTDVDLPSKTKRYFTADNMPAEWRNSVGAGEFVDNDVVIDAMEMGAESFDWFPPGFRDIMRAMLPAQRRQIEAELDMGMMYGMSLSLGGADDQFSSMGMWFADQSSRKAFEKDWQQFGPSLHMAAGVFDTYMRKTAPNTLIGLSPREVDCLCYLVGGLRPAQISDRLGISEKTFEKHISSAKIKLRARTRDQAVAKAIVAGILPL